MIEIRVARSPGERRVALLRDGVLHGYRLERPARPDGVGDVLRGRVTAVAPQLAGGFVALPEDAAGFLPESECPGRRLPPEGTYLTLRVTRAAQNGKGLRLSAKVAQRPGEGPPALLERGPDQALRWAAAYPEAELTVDELGEFARLRGALGASSGEGRVWRGPAFDDALEAEAEALALPEAPLPGGGRLIVSPLPALVAVDVDSGGADPREANRAAIAEFARQLRLRDLAGPILLDLAGLSVRQRAALEPELKAALAGDGLAQLLGLGPLGLFELRRARIHPPLHEVLADAPLARGLALLRRAMREATAAERRGIQPAERRGMQPAERRGVQPAERRVEQAAPRGVGPRRLVLAAPERVLAAIRGLPGALEEHAAMAGPGLVLEAAATEELRHG